MDITLRISPKDLLRRSVEKDMFMKFYKKGCDYMIDENLIIDLYNIYTKNKVETYIMTHEDKVEVTKAYPGLFNYTQKGYNYVIRRADKNGQSTEG